MSPHYGMKMFALLRGRLVPTSSKNPTISTTYHHFSSDLSSGSSNTKPNSEKILQLVERIASLSPGELRQIGPALQLKLRQPRLQTISSHGFDLGPQSGGPSAKPEEKKAEKTAFDVKLEKFDAAAKIKVIKEVRAFTNLGLKEAKDLVEKAPVVMKQGVTKEEANDIIEKIKIAGGVAVME